MMHSMSVDEFYGTLCGIEYQPLLFISSIAHHLFRTVKDPCDKCLEELNKLEEKMKMFKFGDKSKEARCEYNCSKYCEIYDIDGMSKLEGKYVCAACYNCALSQQKCIHGPALCDLSEFPQEYYCLEEEDTYTYCEIHKVQWFISGKGEDKDESE